MRRILSILTAAVSLLLALPASGASFFLTQSGGGSFNGTDWSDAWSDLTGVNWSVVNPGDTIFLGGGGPPLTNRFHIQGSGTPSAPRPCHVNAGAARGSPKLFVCPCSSPT